MISIERYSRNQNSITIEENIILNRSSACVIGCGGLGGYVIEVLGRIGVGKITVVDGDVFDKSNLNRQLLSDEASLGYNKALKAKDRLNVINSEIKVNAITEMLNLKNGIEIINGHDVIIDALDNIKSRLLLEDLCGATQIPLIHGSVGGWYGQVSTIYPGDNILHKIYREDMEKGLETELGNLSYVVANIASIQGCEAVKVILKKANTLRNKILMIDLLNMEHEVIDIK